MDTIKYENKVDLVTMPNIETKNKVTAANMNEIKNVVNAHASSIDQIQTKISKLPEEIKPEVPIGFITTYTSGNIPDGYMECSGQSLNRVEYAELYSVIGTTYGNDSSTTFKLPNSNYNPTNIDPALIPKYKYIIRVK